VCRMVTPQARRRNRSKEKSPNHDPTPTPGSLVDLLALEAAQWWRVSGAYKHLRPSDWKGGPIPVIRHLDKVCGDSPKSLAASLVLRSHLDSLGAWRCSDLAATSLVVVG
jgi:hypothetical protein